MPALRLEAARGGAPDSMQRQLQGKLHALQVKHLVGMEVRPDNVAGAVVRTGIKDNRRYRQDFVRLGKRELPTHEVIITVGDMQSAIPLFDPGQIELAHDGERQIALIAPVPDETPLGEVRGAALVPIRELFTRDAGQAGQQVRRAA